MGVFLQQFLCKFSLKNSKKNLKNIVIIDLIFKSVKPYWMGRLSTMDLFILKFRSPAFDIANIIFLQSKPQ
jgi:hypothetical protein